MRRAVVILVSLSIAAIIAITTRAPPPVLAGSDAYDLAGIVLDQPSIGLR
jgi:hypothetical protein